VQTPLGNNQEGDNLMMKAETLQPMDLELKTWDQNSIRREQIWLTRGQFEVLKIVAKALDQTLAEYITETILSMLECEVDDIISWKLKKKLGIEKERCEVTSS
jgi:hypothetical protein